MTAHPVASVIMPAFNAAETIDVQLEALSKQRDAPAWELLVADNGSADTTVERVHSWSEHFESLIVIDASARRGPGAARNIGASNARGVELLFCDADDAADPHWIEQLSSALKVADAASGSRAYELLNAKRFGPTDWRPPIFGKPPLENLAAASSHNLGVRRAAFNAVGGFDERLGTAEDVDLCWRLQLAGFSFAAAPGALMQIRRRSGILAVFRQAYAYGRGDRVLAQRFAHENVGQGPGDNVISIVGKEAPSATAACKETPGEVKRLRYSLPDLEFRAHRLGHFLGRRITRDLAPPPSRESTP